MNWVLRAVIATIMVQVSRLLYRKWTWSRAKPAVCLFYRREDGKILAVSRKKNRTKFGLPGGKVDPGETPEQAIVREVFEETGLKVTEMKPVFSALCKGQTNYFATTYFAAKVEGEAHTDEPIDIQWVDPQVLLNGPFGDYNRRLFNHLGVK